jgi:hypothetical protein
VEINLVNTIQILSEVLDRQIEIYTEVFHITQEQENVIAEYNEIKLLELIDAKNDLMNKANQCNIQSVPFREYWDIHFEEISLSDKSRLKEKVSVVSDLIQKILIFDEKSKETIENFRSEKNAVASQKNNVKKLKSAYGSTPIKDQFIDKNK